MASWPTARRCAFLWWSAPTWMTVGELLMVLLLVQLQPGSAVLKEGDRCSINDQTGICMLSSACPELNRIQQLGVRPKICAYAANRERIICCPRLDAIPKQAMRKCEQYCDDYQKLASTEVRFGSFSLDSDADRRIFVPKCDEAIGLIVGGTPARPEQFPHIAALGWLENGNYSFKCGGSLISDRYVLTAAHCLVTTDGPPDLVRLGDYNTGQQWICKQTDSCPHW